MKNEYLKEIAAKESRMFLEVLLKDAPADIEHSIVRFFCKKGSTLIVTDEEAGSVFFLLKGSLMAIEEHGKNGLYPFTEIHAPDIVGDFELFSGKTQRLVTLRAMTDCMGIRISIKDYHRWIRKDCNALYIRMQLLMRMMTEQSQNDRKRFLLTNEERVILLLAEECRKKKCEQVQIHYTHEELADHVGCSLRTVNRIVNHLERVGMFHRLHGKILLNRREQDAVRAEAESI